MKKLLIVVLTLAVAFSTTACNGLTSFKNFKAAFFPGDQKTVESTIKIGIFEPLSGQYKDEAKAEISGIELAHALNPKVYGLNVELVYADNKSSMHDGETAIANLMDKDPVIVLGSYGEVLTLVASKYLEDNKTPGITISALNPLITKNNEYFFRATFSEENQGAALADFAYEEQNRTKIAIIKVGTDDTSASEINAFQERLKELVGEKGENPIVANISLLADQTDYTAVFERLKNSGATAVYLALRPETAKNFITQACENGLRYILYMGNRSWDNEAMIDYVKEKVTYNIAFCSDDTKAESEAAQAFIAEYKNMYGIEPTGYASVGYDAYMIALNAITEAYDEVSWKEIPSGEIVRDKLLATKAYDGASGILSYNGSNEAVKTITIHHYLGYSMQQYIEDIANLAQELENREEDPENLEDKTEDAPVLTTSLLDLKKAKEKEDDKSKDSKKN